MFGMALCAALLLSTTPAAASDAALAKVDSTINDWSTVKFIYKVVTGDDVFKLRVRMKRHQPSNKQVVEIGGTHPLKGTKILTLSQSQMYMFIPTIGKIRRIAGHFSDQGFLGTAMDPEQLSLSRYGHLYEVQTSKDGGSEITLTLAARSTDSRYQRLVMVVDKSRWVPTKIEYYNASDEHLKTERRAKYACVKGSSYCTPGVMEVTDHTNGRKTTLTLHKGWQRNPDGITDDIFTKRYLMR